MNNPISSTKGLKLIDAYTEMAESGYDRRDGTRVSDPFSDFELRFYRQELREELKRFDVSSILDYGCGGADWQAPGFDEGGETAMQYFGLDKAYRYEPARAIDERQSVDCVISFDVLEHIFIADVPNVVRDIFSYAEKFVILNVACYPAAATLPNGENAHITVRNPHWWKGIIDTIAIDFPNVSVLLMCSAAWRNTNSFPIWKADDWHNSDSFITNS
ncbi:hypothetical protein V5T82_12470 [Magnetovibrio sp. PR-2]|uniref:hypothetical protein n=1 Tax=Magnetovibrio sp. PR-2 TaxID=3120356 RepID=UPI002FCE2E7B